MVALCWVRLVLGWVPSASKLSTLLRNQPPWLAQLTTAVHCIRFITSTSFQPLMTAASSTVPWVDTLSTTITSTGTLCNVLATFLWSCTICCCLAELQKRRYHRSVAVKLSFGWVWNVLPASLHLVDTSCVL